MAVYQCFYCGTILESELPPITNCRNCASSQFLLISPQSPTREMRRFIKCQIGDGVSNAFVVAHNLNTLKMVVHVDSKYAPLVSIHTNNVLIQYSRQIPNTNEDTVYMVNLN
jgi:DNA-directed RNA polymerase subunit RPC12/RpoP